ARAPTPQAGTCPEDATATDASTERLREVLRDVREDLEGAVELVAAWSAGPGEETRLPPEMKLQLMRNLVRNPRLRRIARLFGRYRRMGLADREAKALLASEEVVDFVQGGEVARALAAELANFAMREREDLFYSKVVQHQLLVYELWQRHERPRPVYLCLDNSGSDFLFVSDGLCPLPEEFVRRFLEAKGRHNIRLTTVVIGGEAFSLAPISDSVHRLEDDLEAGDELAAQFASTFLERASGAGP